jgi:zinc protease
MINYPSQLLCLSSIVSFRSQILAATLTMLLFMVSSIAHAVTIQQVSSSSGVTAWLVEDYTVPIISVSASFRGGAAQDPERQEGMANLLSSLFDEGAGPYDSTAFQARLEKLGVRLSFRDSRDSFNATLRTLRDDRKQAFDMMRLSLTELHFDESAIERMRNALKSRILRQQNDPEYIAGKALREALFGEHPYARPSSGTISGLDSIGREELVNHFSRLFAMDNLTVGIVGAISAEEASVMLDDVFGSLPASAELKPVSHADPEFGQRIDIAENTPQAIIAMALPGVSRQSPEFFAAYLMNHILGGGGFTSRLFVEIRDKRGLAYSVSSDLGNYEYASILRLQSGTRVDRAEETIAVMRNQIESMARNGPTEEELEAAKKFVIGAYAINNLDTSAGIARALVALQEDDLGIDYLEKREELINSVTLEEVKAIAEKLLSQEPITVVVAPQNP